MTFPGNRNANEAQPGAALAPNPDQVNDFHRYDDSDASSDAHHHTLGIDPNQASPGDHNHDGRNSANISGLERFLDKTVNTVEQTVAGVVLFSSRIATIAGIVFRDTRNVNLTPAEIPQRAITFDFKLSSTVGLPGSGYAGVFSIAPWGDDSGNGNHQLGFNADGKVYHRYGTRSGGWGGWVAL